MSHRVRNIPALRAPRLSLSLAHSPQGSATLSMALAGHELVHNVLRALKGDKGVVACAMVESNVVPACKYFANPIELGVSAPACGMCALRSIE
jgi:hypothetical protein